MTWYCTKKELAIECYISPFKGWRIIINSENGRISAYKITEHRDILIKEGFTSIYDAVFYCESWMQPYHADDINNNLSDQFNEALRRLWKDVRAFFYTCFYTYCGVFKKT